MDTKALDENELLEVASELLHSEYSKPSDKALASVIKQFAKDYAQLRARNKELEEYHGFYEGKQIPEGEPTVTEEKLRAENAQLRGRLANYSSRLD